MRMKSKKLQLTEDWTANLLGFVIIFIAVFMLSPHFGDISIKWPTFKWNGAEELTGKVLSLSNLGKIGILFIVFYIFTALAGIFTNKSVKNMLKIYPAVFILTILACIVSGNYYMSAWGLETVIFCLLFGLIISNFFKLPQWVKDGLTSELFVKIGLVLLGAGILFKSMMEAGVYGLVQAVVVILVVWNFCFWLSKKMGVDKDLGVMLSSAVSICGVSAAIATSGAIKGDKVKLSYVISLVLVVAVPMIILLPLIARWLGFSEVLAGAWFGGTIDTTGAVAASGDFYGDIAEQVAMIVKSSQNVLLGIAAFVISIYWSITGQSDREEKPTARVIWDRFPKFVLGFVAASLIFSFCFTAETVTATKGILKSAQKLWFALAFTSIGLETNFRQLISKTNRKATYTFLLAQLFNIFFTLLIAWLLFEVMGGGSTFLE